MMCNIHFCPCHLKDSAAIKAKYPTNASLKAFNRTWGDNVKYQSDYKITVPGFPNKVSAWQMNQNMYYNNGNITSAW